MIVSTHFAFSVDNLDNSSKEMYISFEDAQAALPDKDIYKPEHDNNTRSAPDWEDDPGAYEFVATITAAVSNEGVQLEDYNDI